MRRTIPPSLLILVVLLVQLSPVVSLAQGGQPRDRVVPVQATSDFNGDGAADVAIGAPGEPENDEAAAGAVHVLYGTTDTGLQSTGNQRLTQAGPVLGDPEAGDNFGSAVAVGDFNADGFDDLAIGIPGEDAVDDFGVNHPDSGKMNVIYGTAEGLQADGNQLWSQTGPGTQGDPEEGDDFGSALAGADFNGDGFDDIAIGVPGESVGGIPEAGSVNVMYGSATGIQIGDPDDQIWSQNTGGVEDDAEGNDHFGEVLAAGDFDSDGFGDLAVGAPDENVGSLGNAGAAAVLYGGAGGLQVSNPADQYWHQDSASVRNSAEKSDGFGQSLAAGDFNGDTFADLAIGVPREDISGVSNPGGFAVLHGGTDGLQASAPDDQFWDQNASGVRDTADPGDELGTALAAGDFNGDGRDDLAAGSPGEKIGEFEGAGAVTVMYGSAGGLQASSPDDQFWHQSSGSVEETSEAADGFGSALAAANFDPSRAGGADLVIGVPDEDLAGASGAGTAHVLYSSAGGLQATNPADQLWNQAASGIIGEPEPADAFGASVAAG